MNNPLGVAVDRSHTPNRLWVADVADAPSGDSEAPRCRRHEPDRSRLTLAGRGTTGPHDHAPHRTGTECTLADQVARPALVRSARVSVRTGDMAQTRAPR